MNENVKGIELKYYIRNLEKVTDYTRCKLEINRNRGKVKLEFNRGIGNSIVDGKSYPVEVEYEYKVPAEYLDEKLFSKIDFTNIETEETDVPLAGCGEWKLTVYKSAGKKNRYKGFRPPKDIGQELSEILKNLLDYEKEPIIF